MKPQTFPLKVNALAEWNVMQGKVLSHNSMSSKPVGESLLVRKHPKLLKTIKAKTDTFDFCSKMIILFT